MCGVSEVADVVRIEEVDPLGREHRRQLLRAPRRLVMAIVAEEEDA
jgi:hypothetical protein